MKNDLPQFMSDEEVADALQITVHTLARYLREGPPKKRAKNVLDVRKVKHVVIGGSRRWSRDSFMDVLRQCIT